MHTVHRGGFTQGLKFKYFLQKVTANPANPCGFYIISYPFKYHNSLINCNDSCKRYLNFKLCAKPPLLMVVLSQE